MNMFPYSDHAQRGPVTESEQNAIFRYDKAEAHRDGKHDEYNYNCPLCEVRESINTAECEAHDGMVVKYKHCRGCDASLWQSDPDLCELCDLHARGVRA